MLPKKNFGLFRRRPTFPGSFPPSIISAKELNYCVRDGNRCILSAIITRSYQIISEKEKTGNVLLSQAASRQVSSALRSLTTVFEMGTGVTSSLLSPDFLIEGSHPQN